MKYKSILVYLARFLGAFCLLYFGTKAVIGLTVPGGYYNEWFAKYFDYPALLRTSLLHSARIMAGVFGYNAYLRDAYHVSMVNGRGVHLVYACLGYGLLSFWIAFVFANKGSSMKKIKWMAGGCIVICLANITRIFLVLLSSNQHLKIPVTMDEHTLFNVIVYALIFGMIWLFSRSENRRAAK